MTSRMNYVHNTKLNTNSTSGVWHIVCITCDCCCATAVLGVIISVRSAGTEMLRENSAFDAVCARVLRFFLAARKTNRS